MDPIDDLTRDQLVKRVKSLEKQVEEIRSVADNASDYILRYDREYRHRYANRSAVADSGVGDLDYIGKTHRELGYPSDLCTLWESKFDQVFETGKPLTVEFEVPSAVGMICLEMKLTPELSASGEVGSVLAISRDVTQRRKAEESLLQLQKLDSLGILAGGIAHDFNNLLTGILANLSLANDEVSPGSELAVSISESMAACANAKGLTHQLLTFAQGGRPVVKVATLEPIVREAAAFATRGSRSRCVYQIAEDLPPAEVDKDQLAQVIQNLVINAVQAMPEGGLVTIRMANAELKVGDVPGLGGGQHIKILVHDEGVGIGQDQVPKLFDPYFSTKAEGRGLGLATCHSIIQKHGGHIGVVSSSELGTMLEVLLPATDKSLPTDPSPETHAHVLSGRVLIMDDNETVSRALARILRNLGLKPEIARDGESAILAYEEANSAGNGFALVILDLTIPGGMGGRETMNSLRKVDPDARAIVTSGYSDDPVMSEYRDHGFLGALPKPFKAQQVFEAVYEVLGED